MQCHLQGDRSKKQIMLELEIIFESVSEGPIKYCNFYHQISVDSSSYRTNVTIR